MTATITPLARQNVSYFGGQTYGQTGADRGRRIICQGNPICNAGARAMSNFLQEDNTEGCVIQFSEFSQPLDQVEAIFTILSMRGKGVGRGRNEESPPRAALPSVRPSAFRSSRGGSARDGEGWMGTRAAGRAHGSRGTNSAKSALEEDGELQCARCGD